MKCLSVTGPSSLREAFIRVFRGHLPGKPVGVLRRGDDGGLLVETTGMSDLERFIGSPAPDIVLLSGEGNRLAVPAVYCREGGEAPWEPLELARFHLGEGKRPILAVRGRPASPHLADGCDMLYGRVHHFLPQFDAGQCGRCGMDCRRFAEAVGSDGRKFHECFFSPSGSLRVLIDGEPLRMGHFPSDIVEGTLRGLLSTLTGYREDAHITVELRND